MAKACQGGLSSVKSGKNRWKGQPPKSEKGKKRILQTSSKIRKGIKKGKDITTFLQKRTTICWRGRLPPQNFSPSSL